MIDVKAVRTVVAEALRPAGLTVYPEAPFGAVNLPCVIVGMPAWRAQAEPGLDRWDLPVVVAVAIPSAEPTSAVTGLDAAWPRIVEALRRLCADDPSLGGLCCDSAVESAAFGTVNIGKAGAGYPAYHINLKLFDLGE